MLTLTGRGQTTTCDGMTRRDFMQVGALGAVGLGLPEYLAAKEAGAVKPGHDERACIMIFNLGRAQSARPVRHEAGSGGGSPRPVSTD